MVWVGAGCLRGTGGVGGGRPSIWWVLVVKLASRRIFVCRSGPVDFEYPDQAEVDLLFDIVDEHEKVFALLRVCGLNGGDGDDCTVVFHDDSR